MKLRGLYYPTSGEDDAQIKTRDGSRYLIRHGTLYKEPNEPNRNLSPSKQRRKERRANLNRTIS